MTTYDPARLYQHIQAELSHIFLFLPFSLTYLTTLCQLSLFHCHSYPPHLHLPYPTFTLYISFLTFTSTLTSLDSLLLLPYFYSHRHPRQLIT